MVAPVAKSGSLRDGPVVSRYLPAPLAAIDYQGAVISAHRTRIQSLSVGPAYFHSHESRRYKVNFQQLCAGCRLRG